MFEIATQQLIKKKRQIQINKNCVYSPVVSNTKRSVVIEKSNVLSFNCCFISAICLFAQYITERNSSFPAYWMIQCYRLLQTCKTKTVIKNVWQILQWPPQVASNCALFLLYLLRNMRNISYCECKTCCSRWHCRQFFLYYTQTR